MSGPSQTPGGIRWNEHKAGLEAVDKAKVQAVVTQLSKGSRFYVREQEKAAQLAARVATFRKTADAARSDARRLERAQRIADNRLVPELERSRVEGRVLACLDFDCFFAAVEALDDPTLRGTPHAVGEGDRGVLSTASYEARAYGCRSAMPVFIAKKLCPQLRMVPVRMSRYKEVSKEVEEKVLATYDPGYRMGSIDEAYLDLTDRVAKDGVESVCRHIHEDVRQVTGGLTVSIGVGPNCLIAKIAVDMHKPDGTTIVLPDEDANERQKCVDFMRPLKLRKVPGIGRVLESYLEDGLGLKVVGDIYEQRALVTAAFGERTAEFLLRSALGIGSAHTAVEGEEEHVPKGMSRCRSFAPEKDAAKLMEMLSKMAHMLENDARKRKLLGARTVVLQLKTADFVPHTRSNTLPDGELASTAADFERHAARLLRIEMPVELRLVGIGLQNLRFEDADRPPDPKTSIKRFLKAPATAPATAPDNIPSSIAYRSLGERIAPRRKGDGQIRFKRCEACALGLGAEQGAHLHAMVCPLCLARCFRDLGALNAHLDKCLESGGQQAKRRRVEP